MMRRAHARREIDNSLLKLNTEQLRTQWHGVSTALRAHLWFPHIRLAVLMWLGGVWLLRSDLGRDWQHYFAHILDGSRACCRPFSSGAAC